MELASTPGFAVWCVRYTARRERSVLAGLASGGAGEAQNADRRQKVHEVLHLSPLLLPCDLLVNCLVSSNEDDDQMLDFLPMGEGKVYFMTLFLMLLGFSSSFGARTQQWVEEPQQQ